MQHVTPQSDSILKNRCLGRIGKIESQNLGLDEVEQLIARIYKKESEFRSELEKNKYNLATLGTAGLEESFLLLVDQSLGYLTFQR